MITIRRCTIAAGMLAAGLCIGCEKASKNKVIVLNPTTRQSMPVVNAVTQPALTTRPATTQAAKKSSHMMINGVWVEFPEPKLIIKKDGDRLTAFLGSNDPPEVIQPSYQGNRYYFELALDNVDDVKNIAQADFRYRASSAEPTDTPNGIFLDGDRQHLTPFDIQVVFDRVDDKIVADIRGQFLYFPKGTIVGQWIPVVATLTAKAEGK